MNASSRTRLGLLLAAILALLGACGGGDNEVVTVWRFLPLAQGVDDEGNAWWSWFPAPDSSVQRENQLREAGVQPLNKRCATDSYNFGGELVLYPEGIPPTYVLFDIAAADLGRAEAAGFKLFDPDETFIAKPFWKCEIRGY